MSSPESWRLSKRIFSESIEEEKNASGWVSSKASTSYQQSTLTSKTFDFSFGNPANQTEQQQQSNELLVARGQSVSPRTFKILNPTNIDENSHERDHFETTRKKGIQPRGPIRVGEVAREVGRVGLSPSRPRSPISSPKKKMGGRGSPPSSKSPLKALQRERNQKDSDPDDGGEDETDTNEEVWWKEGGSVVNRLVKKKKKKTTAKKEVDTPLLSHHFNSQDQPLNDTSFDETNSISDLLDRFISEEREYIRNLEYVCNKFISPLFQWFKERGAKSRGDLEAIELPLNVLSLHQERIELLQKAVLNHPDSTGMMCKKASESLHIHLHSFLQYYVSIIFRKEIYISRLNLLHDLYRENMDLDTSDESSESPEEGELKVGMGVYEFEDQTIKIEIQDAILLPNQFFAVQNRILHILSDLTYSPQGFAVSSVQVYLQTLLCVFGRDRMGGKSVRKDETTTQDSFLLHICRTRGLFGNQTPLLLHNGMVSILDGSKKKQRYFLLVERGLIVCQPGSEGDDSSGSLDLKANFRFRSFWNQASFLVGDADPQSLMIKVFLIDKRDERMFADSKKSALMILCSSLREKRDWLFHLAACTLSYNMMKTKRDSGVVGSFTSLKNDILLNLMLSNLPNNNMQTSEYWLWLDYHGQMLDYEAILQAFEEAINPERKKKGKSFLSSRLVHWIIANVGVDNTKAIEIGKTMEKKGLIYPAIIETLDDKLLFRKTESFDDKPTLYNLSDQKCLNLTFLSTDPGSSKSAGDLSETLVKYLLELLELFNSIQAEFSSQMALSLIPSHPKFAKFLALLYELQRIDPSQLDDSEKITFLINVHNLLWLHSFVVSSAACLKTPYVEGQESFSPLNPPNFVLNYKYKIGGTTLSAIEIIYLLRGTQTNDPVGSLEKKFLSHWAKDDRRWAFQVKEPTPLFLFSLCHCTESSPSVPCLSVENLWQQLELGAGSYLSNSVKVWWQNTTFKLTLPKLVEWFGGDFGKFQDIIQLLLRVLQCRTRKSKLEAILEKLPDEVDLSLTQDTRKAKFEKDKNKLKGLFKKGRREMDSLPDGVSKQATMTNSRSSLSERSSGPAILFSQPSETNSNSELISSASTGSPPHSPFLSDLGQNSHADTTEPNTSQFHQPAQKGSKMKNQSSGWVIRSEYFEYNGTFKYPVGLSVHEIMANLGGSEMSKSYSFPISSGNIYMREELLESKYAFEIPYQYLDYAQQFQQQLIEEMVLSSRNLSESLAYGSQENPTLREIVNRQMKVIRERTKYCSDIQDARDLYKNYDGKYNSLTFKPSTFKEDIPLRFVATNLHTQCQRVSNQPYAGDTPFLSATNPPRASETAYDFVTFGAPAAHVCKFRGEDLKLLIDHYLLKYELFQLAEEQLITKATCGLSVLEVSSPSSSVHSLSPSLTSSSSPPRSPSLSSPLGKSHSHSNLSRITSRAYLNRSTSTTGFSPGKFIDSPLYNRRTNSGSIPKKAFQSLEDKPLMPSGWDDNIDDVFLEGEALEASLRDRENIRGVMRNCSNFEVGLAMLKIELDELQLEIDLRFDSAFCQVLGALATCLAQKFTLLFHLGDERSLLQFKEIGILIQFESLLSTIGAELGMLGDMEAAVCLVGRVAAAVKEKEHVVVEGDASRQEDVTVSLRPFHLDKNDQVIETEHSLRSGSLYSSANDPLYLMTFEIPSALWSSLRGKADENTYFKVIPVFFTQGINEQQSKAIMLGQTETQELVNKKSLERLREYFLKFVRWIQLDRIRVLAYKSLPIPSQTSLSITPSSAPSSSVPSSFSSALSPFSQSFHNATNVLGSSTVPVPSNSSFNPSSIPITVSDNTDCIKDLVIFLWRQMDDLTKIINTSHREKNTQILPKTADFTRRINGLRLISCKSAKDRTSMSVTWEMARNLSHFHFLPSSEILSVADVFREEGVRLENAWKNIGKKKFAFNKLQRSMIPEEYRAKSTICSEGQT